MFTMTGRTMTPSEATTVGTMSDDVKHALDFLPKIPADGQLHEIGTYENPAKARGKANGLNSSSHLIDKAQFVARGTSLFCRVLTAEEGAARVAERNRRRADRKAERAAAKAVAV